VRSTTQVVWKDESTREGGAELKGEEVNCSEAEFWDYIEVMTQVNQGSPEVRVEVQGVSGRFEDDMGPKKAASDLRVSFVGDLAVVQGPLPRGAKQMGEWLRTMPTTVEFPPMGLGDRVSASSFIRAVKSEICEGMDGEATRDIVKGEWFYYQGPTSSVRNEYSLEVQGVNAVPGLGIARPTLVDGRVTDTNKLGLVNEFIWDANRNNLRFCDMGLVEAVRDIKKGENFYIGYGPEHDWDGVKVGLVHELGVRLLSIWEVHGAPEHKEDILRLVESMVG